MNKPHKHAECIKAWADGAEIERFDTHLNKWEVVRDPCWVLETSYRIKPQPVIKKMYMHYDDIERHVKNGGYDGDKVPQKMYLTNFAMGNHLEFTFTDNKLTSVTIVGPTE